MGLQPKITVTPDPCLFSEPTVITISHLPPCSLITVMLQLKDEHLAPWFQSAAVFEADDQGIVNLSSQAPLSGSYSGIDPMGLFWSLQLIDFTEEGVNKNGNEEEFFLSVYAGDTLIAERILTRFFASPDIETRNITEDGLVGVLCYPKTAFSIPGIITLSGSGGGLSRDMAKMLASYGYAVLALAYFRKPGLPDKLEYIELEYFQKALRWLKSQPQVNAKKIALRGASYGGDLVLLLASLFPEEMQAVIAITPPSVVLGGFPRPNHPAWIYNGAPVGPFLGGLTNQDPNLTETEDLRQATAQGLIPFHKGTFEDPYEITPLFLARLKKYSACLPELEIPVERMICPLLIISGESDKVHPASLYAKRIMDRLEEHGSPIARQHLNFPEAGHSLKTPYESKVDLPSHLAEGVWYRSGGTLEGNAYASKQAWEAVLNFLKKNLR